jgi:hypothetical protein
LQGAPVNLTGLLSGKGIDPRNVLVLRHRPTEPRLNDVIPWLAAEKPDVFNAYQQTQGEKLERAMTGTKYIASFLGREPSRALFVGLYEIGASRPLTFEQYWKVPAHVEMKAFGMRGFRLESGRESLLWFDLALTDFYADWKGKLIVGWPPPERSWWRRAHKNDFPVLAVLDQSALVTSMPGWQQITLNWEQLAVLPARWRSALSQWRGIYFIFDTLAGKGYVGSAYGADNILGRWLGYARSGHGGNRLLRDRDPKNFQFSILERVSPDLEAEEVIGLESSWKERLHTRAPFGLNEN